MGNTVANSRVTGDSARCVGTTNASTQLRNGWLIREATELCDECGGLSWPGLPRCDECHRELGGAD